MFEYELVSCPVCESKLGRRNKKEAYIVQCNGELCNTLWIWKKGSKKPLPLSKQKEAIRCGCNGCGR